MSNERLNPNYDAGISLEKGAKGAAVTGVGGALTTLVLTGATLAQGGQLSEAATTAAASAVVALGTAVCAGIVEWWRNRKKHRKTRRSGRFPVVLLCAGLALSGLLSGCTTTTLPDGSIVRSVDVSAWERAYDALDRAIAEREAQGQETGGLVVEVNGVLYDEAALRDELRRRGVVVRPE